jgi:hypothetical protein
VDDVKKVVVIDVAASEEVVGGEGGVGESTMTAVAARSIVVDASVVGAAVIGPVVAAQADLEAVESATGRGEGDAGASTIAGVDVAAAVIGAADLVEASSALAEKAVADLDVKQASGEVSEVKPHMQKEVMVVSDFICFGLVHCRVLFVLH